MRSEIEDVTVDQVMNRYLERSEGAIRRSAFDSAVN